MSQVPGSVATTQRFEVDVVIVGLGPVGLFASLLLGQRGHSVLAIERWPTPYPLPRAVTFDHEIARILSSIGIDADHDSSIDYHDDRYLWVDARDEVLTEVDWISKAADGWRNRYWFNQPDLENRLRLLLAEMPSVTLLPGNEVVDFEQDADGVTIRFEEAEAAGAATQRKAGGTTGVVRARWALGSDGANSFIRRATNREFTDLQFFSDWLVVDVTPAEMPSYKTAHFQICNPARPTTVVPGGPGKRRWEFMALPGEDLGELGSPAKVWELLKPWGMNPDTAQLDRAVVWRFQAKYVENWRAGRALLAGDAAHLMPPFAGEGMCAGLRDVFNLAWRLDLVLREVAGDDLLDEWSNERREQAKWYIDFSVELGKVICVTDPTAAAERDARMKADWAVQSKIGPVSPHDAVLGTPGTWAEADVLSGRPSVQGVVTFGGRTGRFDDIVGRGWHLLSLLGQGKPLRADQAARLAAAGGRQLTIGPTGSGADVVEEDGAYSGWMTAHGVTQLLVRPDFYIAATAPDVATMQSAFDDVFDSVVPVRIGARLTR